MYNFGVNQHEQYVDKTDFIVIVTDQCGMRCFVYHKSSSFFKIDPFRRFELIKVQNI